MYKRSQGELERRELHKTSIENLLNTRLEITNENLGKYHIDLLFLYRDVVRNDLTIANKINKEITKASVIGKMFLDKLGCIMTTDTTDIFFNYLIQGTSEKRGYYDVKPDIKLCFNRSDDEYYWLINRVGIIGLLHIMFLMYTECI